MPLFETVTDLQSGADVLSRRSYGVIEAVDGRFRRVVLRPYPKLVSVPGVLWAAWWRRGRCVGDRCLLYYDQPGRMGNFLALKYIVSDRGTTRASISRVLEALDHIARLKRTDAVLCDVTNRRISTRMLTRRGWQPHSPSRWHRHYIKRFYGAYPPAAGWIARDALPATA